MANILEELKEVREDIDSIFTALDVTMLSDERKKAEEIERKLAHIEEEIGAFFSGQF